MSKWRRVLGWGLALWSVTVALSCKQEDRGSETPLRRTSFFVQTDSVAALATIGEDSLSDSAYVSQLVPEPDGRTFAVVLADPERGITAALAITDSEGNRARLVWPDSVRSVWWAGEHRLAFQSIFGTMGVHAIVDVHADSLEHLESAHDTVPNQTAGFEWPRNVRARAVGYVDSLRRQPAGVPERGTLTYQVTAGRRAPNDSLLAFYVAAYGPNSAGRSFNPTWYLMDLYTLQITPVDSITGPARAMLSEAAGWTLPGAFVYAKGASLYEARISPQSKTLR